MTRMTRGAALLALLLAVGAVPALADEGETPDEIEEPAEGLHSPLAMLLAGEFGMTLEEIQGLNDLGLGFGDIFRLKSLATVLQTDLETLLAGATVDPETGEYEFDWGALRATLTEEQLALLGEFPKNFGQLVSAYQRHHGRDEHQPEHAHGGQGHGKPEGTGKPEGRGKPDGDDQGA